LPTRTPHGRVNPLPTQTIDILPKQELFLRSIAREVLYSGAWRAGKTRALCYKCAIRAAVPGAREGLCRKHLVTFRATTLRTLLEPDGGLPAVLPAGTYTHNKTDKIIRLRGGGEIVYFGLDEPEKIGSYSLTGCGADEAVEFTETDWDMLHSRISVGVPAPPGKPYAPVDEHGNLINQLSGACNPGSPSHFLAGRFGITGGAVCPPNRQVIQTSSLENTFLPQPYIESLKAYTGITRKRFVEGLWVGSEGLVYGMWDRAIFVRHRKVAFPRYVAAVDLGYTNPAAILLGGIDEDGRLHVCEEWYANKRQSSEIARAVAKLCGTLPARLGGVEWIAVDPSAAMFIDELRAAGLPAVAAGRGDAARRNVLNGIYAVQNRLQVAGDGEPRLTVSPTCENTIREMETYEWMPDRVTGKGFKDVPVKAHDHAMDALRYMVVDLDGVPDPRISLISDEEEPLTQAEIDADHEKHPGMLVATDLGVRPREEDEERPDDWLRADNDAIWRDL